jgi:hypothetical protein
MTTTEHPFRRVRRAGVPLVAYATGDPWASVTACLDGLNGTRAKVPAFQWDCLRGLAPLDKLAAEFQAKRGPAAGETTVLQFALAALNSPGPDATADDPITLPPGAVVFLHNAQRFLDDPAVVQGFCNLRNPAKGIGATIILLGPSFTLPAELRDDVISIDEPSPGAETIARIVSSGLGDARAAAAEQGITFPEPDLDQVANTLTGYRAEFPVDQSLALSLSRDGVDMDRLWDLKVRSLRQTAGLDISRPKVSFDDLRGADGAKRFLSLAINGRTKPHGVFLLDELEKMTAGSTGGDLSGTSQAMMEQFLQWVELGKVQGLLMVGVPGAGKTRTAECCAGAIGGPLLRGSMSSVKGSLVGQSEANMKALLRAVDAVTQGKPLMLATCNSLDNLAPELMARFKLGIMFFDYPGDEEARDIWEYYMAKYELTGEIPQARNWVGREIESCCYRAWSFGCTLHEAAETVVPVSVANGARMEALRQSASGRFLSAAKPGAYEFRPAAGAIAIHAEPSRLKMTL